MTLLTYTYMTVLRLYTEYIIYSVYNRSILYMSPIQAQNCYIIELNIYLGRDYAKQILPLYGRVYPDLLFNDPDVDMQQS